MGSMAMVVLVAAVLVVLLLGAVAWQRVRRSGAVLAGRSGRAGHAGRGAADRVGTGRTGSR
jgi:hypothetical protein